MKSALFAVLSLLLLSVSAQDPPPASEMPPASTGEMELATGNPSFCSSSLDVIMAEIRELWRQDGLNVTIHCLAFDRERMLESGTVSTIDSNGTPLTRYTLRCQGNALTATQSSQPARRLDITNQPYRACVECEDNAVAADICVEPCPIECDRCARFLPEGVLCTDCVRYHLLNSYPRGSILTAEQVETVRTRLEEAGQEEVCTDTPEINPEDATMFTCVEECPDGGNFSEPAGIDNVCYACGIEYCVECERSEGEGGRDECRVCLADTLLFDGRCYSCPEALIARTAILQEAEEQEELAEQRARQIELAVALPTVSVLVIVFFLAMSIYAHHRYPSHSLSTDAHGAHVHKADLFVAESSTHTQPHSSRTDLVDAEWQGRPSVR